MTTRPVTVRLPVPLFERLRHHAASAGWSVHYFVQVLLVSRLLKLDEAVKGAISPEEEAERAYKTRQLRDEVERAIALGVPCVTVPSVDLHMILNDSLAAQEGPDSAHS